LQIYNGHVKTLMLGEMSALISAAIWLMIATVMKIPVSGQLKYSGCLVSVPGSNNERFVFLGTHSIVGATMGFSLVKMGGFGIQWLKLAGIVGSWFVSPILAGIVSSILFLLIRHFILRRDDHLEPALHAMPIFYSITIFVNVSFGLDFRTGNLVV
jgi:solute carrier family 20 (sodium-dependent phosphate transporter)